MEATLSIMLSRATIFTDSKKEDTLRGGEGGVSYFTSELFLCEGAPLIKCKGGRRNSIPNLRLSLIFIHHSREMGSIFKPLPGYSKSIKYPYHQLYVRISIIWN